MNFGRYRISDHHTLPNDYSHFMSLSSKTFMSIFKLAWPRHDGLDVGILAKRKALYQTKRN